MKSIYQVMPFALVLGLVGCGSEEKVEQQSKTTPEKTTPEKTTVAEEQPAFVSKLPDSAPTMKVAVTNSAAPFMFKNEYGIHEGIDIDIIRAIGEEQGFKVRFKREKWKTLMPSVASGKRDIAINGINYSEERAQKYGLSKPYFYNPSALMYINGTKEINGIEDLTGLEVGVVEQSKNHNQLKDISGIKLTTTPTSFLLLQKLIKGNVDAIAMDMPVLQLNAKEFPDIKFKIVPYEDETNLSANTVIVMAKGNDELIKKVNDGIDKIKETGEYDRIKEKWLGTAK